MTINIIIFDCGLELARNLNSKKLKHPVFVNDKKRRKKKSAGELLLDISVHYSGMSPEDRYNRGRPDIVHQIMLQYHFSFFNHESIIKTNTKPPIKLFIHSRQDLVFEVVPEWRVPVSYLRFRGLMEKLLIEKRIENPDIRIRKLKVEELFKEIKADSVILWTEKGDKVNLEDYKLIDKEKEIIWLIGGFQSGDPDDKIDSLVDKKLKIFNYSLPSWKIFSVLLTNLELNYKNSF
jgi:rRNA small subunit pseudouridine methyltransferase Nep1